jgi:FkbM family methyltransferase
MITQQHIISKILRSFSLRMLRYIENENNTNFETNGEKVFIENLFGFLKNEEIVCFDVGANTGTYTQLLLQRRKNVVVHVFEPTVSCFQVLTEKFCQNFSVFLNNKAVSNNNGEVEIFYDKQKSGLASLYKRNLDFLSIEMNASEIVDTIRLDSYIEEKHVQHIHLLKMDIEGHEQVALEGLGKYLDAKFIDFIQFEYGGANLDSCTSLLGLATLLKQRGFVLAKVMPKGLEIRSYQPWMENFQYSNYVAISQNIIGKIRSFGLKPKS